MCGEIPAGFGPGGIGWLGDCQPVQAPSTAVQGDTTKASLEVSEASAQDPASSSDTPS